MAKQMKSFPFITRLFIATFWMALFDVSASEVEPRYTVFVDREKHAATVRGADATNEGDAIDGLYFEIIHLDVSRTSGSWLSLSVGILVGNGFPEDVYLRSLEAIDIYPSVDILTKDNRNAKVFGGMGFRSGRKDFTLLAGRKRTGSKTGIRDDAVEIFRFTKPLGPPGDIEMFKLVKSPEIEGATADAVIRVYLQFSRSGIDHLSEAVVEIPMSVIVGPKADAESNGLKYKKEK